jgi:hypothetical protein
MSGTGAPSALGGPGARVTGTARDHDLFRFVLEVPACPQCSKADVEVGEWTRITRDGKRLASIILTSCDCTSTSNPMAKSSPSPPGTKSSATGRRSNSARLPKTKRGPRPPALGSERAPYASCPAMSGNRLEKLPLRLRRNTLT